MLFKRRKVKDFEIKCILRDFIKPLESMSSKIIIHFEVTKRGVLNIYTNRPGILIGRGGEDFQLLNRRFREECNVKDVKLYEMKNIVSNCGIY